MTGFWGSPALRGSYDFGKSSDIGLFLRFGATLDVFEVAREVGVPGANENRRDRTSGALASSID